MIRTLRSRVPPTPRLAVVVTVAFVLCVSAVAGIGAANHGDLHVSVSNVSISPEQPNPGERTTVSVTVQNAESSADAFEVTDVYVRRAGSTRDLARAEDLGTVPVGSSMDVPLTLSFEEPGVQDLRVRVVGHHENGTRSLEYPLSVSVVEEEAPQLSIDEGRPIAGVETPVNVSVSNGASVALESLELSLNGSTASVRNPRRVASELGAGAERSFGYSVTFTDAGSVPVDATLRYRTSSGDARTIRERFTVRVDDPAESTRLARIELTGVSVQSSGDRVTVTGSASNVGLGEANSVVVRGVPAEGVAPVPPNREYFVGTVPASDFVSFDVTARVDANVTEMPLEVTYLAEGVRRTETVSVPIDRSMEDESAERNPSDGGGPVSLASSVLATVGVAAIVVFGWRRWRGGGT